MIDWTAQQAADLTRAQNIAASANDLGVLGNRFINQFGPGIVDRIKGIPSNILDKAKNLFTKDKTGKKNTGSVPGTPADESGITPASAGNFAGAQGNQKYYDPTKAGYDYGPLGPDYVPKSAKAREGKKWIDEANELGVSLEELAKIKAREKIAKEYDMTPEEIQYIMDNKLHKKDNPKYNKNIGEKDMAQGWFPGKHLAQGMGNIAGKAMAMPGNIKARGNPFTNQTGLFQGGEQGRFLGRFRDALEGGFQQGRGTNPILQAKANETKGMSTPAFRAGAQGLIPKLNLQGKNPVSGTFGPGAGGPGAGGTQGGGAPGGGMPGVGTQERKAEYDRRNWAYDDTIPGYQEQGGYNLTPMTPAHMMTPLGGPIWAGQQIYENWDPLMEDLGGVVDTISDYWPTPTNVGNMATDFLDYMGW